MLIPCLLLPALPLHPHTPPGEENNQEKKVKFSTVPAASEKFKSFSQNQDSDLLKLHRTRVLKYFAQQAFDLSLININIKWPQNYGVNNTVPNQLFTS